MEHVLPRFILSALRALAPELLFVGRALFPGLNLRDYIPEGLVGLVRTLRVNVRQYESIIEPSSLLNHWHMAHVRVVLQDL